MLMSMHICGTPPMDYRTTNHCACCGNDLTNVAAYDCPYCLNTLIRVPGVAVLTPVRAGLAISFVRRAAAVAFVVWLAALFFSHH